MKSYRSVEEVIEKYEYKRDINRAYEYYLRHEEKYPFLKFIECEVMKRDSFVMLYESGFRLNVYYTMGYFYNNYVMFNITKRDEEDLGQCKYEYNDYIWELRTAKDQIRCFYNLTNISDIYEVLRALKEFCDDPEYSDF